MDSPNNNNGILMYGHSDVWMNQPIHWRMVHTSKDGCRGADVLLRFYPPSVNYFFLAINQEKHKKKQKTGAIEKKCGLPTMFVT